MTDGLQMDYREKTEIAAQAAFSGIMRRLNKISA
jgi:hypothetical protein